MQGPFRGVRILDCSEGIGGPLAAMLLGDLGADVIKVEPPAGDRLRGTPAFHVLNRSKRGLVADLRSDAGRRRLAPLLRDADVLILGGPPSTYAERGLDPESLHRTHPQLIVVQVPMYGRQGPFVDLQEDDAMLSALCGPVGTQPSHSGRPVYQTLPASSAGQGILTALTIGACLVNRERTGRGDGVEVSGLTAGYAFMASLAIPDVAPAVERLTNPRFAYPTYGFHQGSDGQWFFIGAIGIRDWVRIANALGLDDFLNDPAFSAGVLGVERPEDARRLLEKLEAIFRTQPRAHWLQVMIDAECGSRAAAVARGIYAGRAGPAYRHGGQRGGRRTRPDPTIGAADSSRAERLGRSKVAHRGWTPRPPRPPGRCRSSHAAATGATGWPRSWRGGTSPSPGSWCSTSRPGSREATRPRCWRTWGRTWSRRRRRTAIPTDPWR